MRTSLCTYGAFCVLLLLPLAGTLGPAHSAVAHCPSPPRPLPPPRYVYDVRTSNDGVTLPGRTPAAILRMGAALHVTHRLRLFLFRLRCLASSSQLDPQDPLSMVLGHPAVKGDASLAAAAERILGVHQSRKHALWLPPLGAPCDCSQSVTCVSRVPHPTGRK